MGWRMGILAASATCLALGACNKPAGEKAASAEGAAKPAAAATASAPAAMPTRKEGLWKQTVSTAGMKQVSSICIDKAVESKLQVWGGGMAKSVCQETAITPAAGGWSFSSTCDMGTGGKTTSHGTVTGDFNSAYSVESESTTEGAAAPQMNGPHKMSLTAEYQGPCPADMKPGDMTLGNGMKINMLDMAAGRPPGMPRPAK